MLQQDLESLGLIFTPDAIKRRINCVWQDTIDEVTQHDILAYVGNIVTSILLIIWPRLLLLEPGNDRRSDGARNLLRTW